MWPHKTAQGEPRSCWSVLNAVSLQYNRRQMVGRSPSSSTYKLGTIKLCRRVACSGLLTQMASSRVHEVVSPGFAWVLVPAGREGVLFGKESTREPSPF